MIHQSEVRRQLVRMVMLVLVLDVAAMLLYSFMRLRAAGTDVKLGFTTAWTILTLAIVLTGLRRIRLARNAARRDSSGQRW